MSKKLVAYFSASGVTAGVAAKLAQATDAQLYEIKPSVPYTKADLDWMDKTSRSTLEMQDKSSRPEIADCSAPVAECDVVYVGFPIWWYVAPTIINTFLEAYDFGGKTIVLFATSGGSGWGKTVESLENSAKGAKIVEGKVISPAATTEEIKAWAESLDL